MAAKNTVGHFQIDVSAPYPVWITIIRGDVEIRIHHQELSDLKYAIQWAERQAKLLLGEAALHELL